MDYLELLENSNDFIQVVDFTGQIIYANRMWQKTLGYPKDELYTLSFFDLLHADCHCDCQARVQSLLAGNLVPRFEVAFRSRAGEKIIAEGSISLYKENGEPCGIQGIFRNIDARKKAEQELVASEALFRAIFQSSVAGIAMVAPDGRFLQINPAFCNFLGYSADELLHLKITDVTHPDDVEETFNRRNISKASRAQAIVCEKRYLRKDGSVFWAQLSSTWLFDAEGNPLYTVPVIQDISKRKEAELRIRELAYYDGLTHLPNRSLFRDRLERTLAHARRHKGTFALMFLDMDRFKMVNDTLGHAIGDQLLCHTAARLAECLRENDTVARLGGDEFVIILSDYRGESNLNKIATKILQTLAKPFDLGMREVFSSTSIGVALYPQDGENQADLLRCADMAMYAAKNMGGNTFQFYSAEMNAKAISRMDMEANMRRALVNNEFFVEYQPQIDVLTKKIAGVEALVRWQHPTIGVIAPDDFIPLAEDTKLILPLGELVMEMVFNQCVRWEQQQCLPLRVAINVSGCQLVQSDFVETVCRLLQETGADPECLEFELTESVVMRDVDTAIVTMNRLRALGINLAVDDFGTGYSSLSSLKKLPVDRLKIDKSFIDDLHTNANGRAIVDATIAMAKCLELKIIAEGVETADQYAFVHDSLCDEVQGFYCSKPVSAEEIQKKWLVAI